MSILSIIAIWTPVIIIVLGVWIAYIIRKQKQLKRDYNITMHDTFEERQAKILVKMMEGQDIARKAGKQ